MNRILIFLLLFVALGVQAATLNKITATVTVTAAPTLNGYTLTVNGNVRTWTNNVIVSQSQILTNLTAAGSKTNMLAQIGLNAYPNVAAVDNGATSIKLIGNSGTAMAVTLAGGWGTIVFTTNVVSALTDVRVPYDAEPSAGQQTNITSGVTAMLNASPNTNSINDFSLAASNLMGLHTTQTVSGAKSLTNVFNLFTGNTLSTFNTNPTMIGFIELGGVRFDITARGLDLFDYSAGSTIASFTNGGLKITSSGFFTLEAGTPALNKVLASDSGGHATWQYVPGLTNAAMRGAYFDATNTFPAGSDVAFGRFSLSSLATGVNAAIPVGTNVFVEVSGPGAAFTINGIAGGRDGKFLIILNQTTFNMTIAHDSGTDPTPANRIYTMTGADRATTGNGAAMFIYSGAASRWILISLDQ
ncbi:MAG TPA: hypothetical protein VN794_16240 [Methylomirabilota bacterium]|nr:hypothetical protein [Methylomirabilota bacterium]